MSDLVRFGVAMERALLSRFDERIAARGYENRSEALRDLVRRDLTRADSERGSVATATISAVWSSPPSEARSGAPLCRAAPGVTMLASMVTPIDESRTLEVMVVFGAEPALAELTGRISALRGAMACELSIATVGPDGRPDGRGEPR